MNHLDDKSALTLEVVRPASVDASMGCLEKLDDLKKYKVVAFLEFFNLLAKWEAKEITDGN
jgi:hypothetical protein